MSEINYGCLKKSLQYVDCIDNGSKVYQLCLFGFPLSIRKSYLFHMGRRDICHFLLGLEHSDWGGWFQVGKSSQGGGTTYLLGQVQYVQFSKIITCLKFPCGLTYDLSRRIAFMLEPFELSGAF